MHLACDIITASLVSNNNSCIYRIYSKKRRGAYLVFVFFGAALIRGRRLFGGGDYLKHELLRCKQSLKYTHLELKMLSNTAVNY